MTLYHKLMVTTVIPVALAIPFAMSGVAWSQADSNRQIKVEETDKGDAAADKEEKEEKGTKAEKDDDKEDKAEKDDKDDEKDTADKDSDKDDDDKEKAEADDKDAGPDKADADDKDKDEEEDVALVLQKELKRVGCYYGALDGIWGPMSKDALYAFGHFAHIHIDDHDPSEKWIDKVKGKKKTVCHHGYGYGGPGPGYYGGPGGYGPGYGGGYRGGY